MIQMRSVGLFEAKNKLSELVEAARGGEEIVLTKRGKPVARLIAAASSAQDSAAAEAALARLDARREARARTGMGMKRGEILDLIRQGRKY